MKELKWKLRTFDGIDYNNINPGLLLREMLKYRGIEDPESWLQVSKENENDPSLLKNIDEATNLLQSVIIGLENKPSKKYIYKLMLIQMVLQVVLYYMNLLVQ